MDNISQLTLLMIIAALAAIIIVLLILLMVRRKKLSSKKPVPVTKASIDTPPVNNGLINNRPTIMAPVGKTVNVKYDYSASKHIGAREEQQDSFAVVDGLTSQVSADFVGILCDGMGGLADGGQASGHAVDYMKSNISKIGLSVPDDLITMIKDCNKSVVSMANEKGLLGQMGTTLLTVIFKDSKMYWGSVGDSRIYIFRAGVLTQVNAEHNYRLQLIERVCNGDLLRQEALDDEDGEKLISFIGMEGLSRIEISNKPFTMEKGDRLLMCSDGLYNTLSDGEIQQIMSQTIIKNAAKTLISTTINRNQPFQDNVSIIVAEYRGE